MTSVNSSKHSLADVEKPSASGVTTPDIVDTNKKEVDSHKAEDGSPAVTEEYPTGKRIIPVLVSLILAVFLVSLDMTIVGTAIPKITDEFHGLEQVSWISKPISIKINTADSKYYGSAYFLTFGGFQSPTGKLFKYLPLKTSFLACIFIFEVGSLICAVSQNSVTFIVGRAFAGLGAAGTATGAFTIVAFAAEPRLRPGLMGLIGAVYGLSSVVGPILGGVFADKITWRWCFYINLPVGGLSMLLIFLFFKTPVQAQPVKASTKEKFLQMDPVGICLIMGGIISFILALQYGGQKYSWDSSVVIGLLVGAAVIWIIFVAWEIWQGERAMLMPRLIRQRSIWQSGLFQFFLASGYFVLLYYLPIYFQSVDNDSPVKSGVRNLPLVIAIAIGSTVSGIVVSKTGHAAPFQVVCAVLTTVAAGLIYTFDIGTSNGKWIGYQIFYGLSIGLCFQMAINIAQANAKPEDISAATATVFFFQTIGGAFCIAAAQAGFQNKLLGNLPAGVDPLEVITTGATQIRSAFPADKVPGIVSAYMDGIKVTLALVVGLTGFSALISFLVPWQRINAESIKESGGGIA